MRRLWMASIGCCCGLLMCSGSAMSQVAWAPPGDIDRRVGLVVVGEDADTRQLDQQMAGAFDDRTMTVVRKTPVDDVDRYEVGGDMTEMYEEGRQAYFFDGADAAYEHLAEQFAERSLEVSEYWMGDGDKTQALFDAAILLIRAHFDREELDDARDRMEALVAAFPAHRPDRRSVPPDVVELWEEIQGTQANHSAVVDVRHLDGEECNPRLNGAVIDGEAVEVAPGRSYIFSGGCGAESRSQWWVSVDGGERRRIRAVGNEVDASTIDAALEAWMVRWDLDAAIYIGPGECTDRREASCVASRGAGDRLSNDELRDVDDADMQQLIASTIEAADR